MSFHRKLSQWYHQLAQSLNAGIGIRASLEQLDGPGGKDISKITTPLAQGLGFDDALRNAPSWLPFGDKLLLSAGAESGNLPVVLKSLSESHQKLHENRRKWIASLAYPFFLVHFILLIRPFANPIEFMENVRVLPVFELIMSYGKQVIIPLLWIWMILIISILFWKKIPLFRNVFSFLIPGLLGYRREVSYARFSDTLESLLEAGVGAEEAYGGAAIVSKPSTVSKKVIGILPRIRNGESPSKLFADEQIFPSQYLSLFITGSKTGTLSQSLSEITKQAEERANDRLKALRITYATLIYFIVVVFIGVKVLQGMQSYLETITSFLE